MRRTAVLAVGAVAVGAAVVVAVLLLRPSEPTTEERMQTLVSSEDPKERTDAARHLAETLDPAVAARVAGLAKSGGAAEIGLRALTDEYVAIYGAAPSDRQRRIAAIRCLARIDSDRTVDAVTAALIDDRAAPVREAAVVALGKMPRNSAGAVKRLIAQRRKLTAKDESRAAQVERALVKIGRPSVRPLLPLVGESDWAAPLIGRIGPQAVDPLTERLSNASFQIKFAASHGLLAIGRSHPEAVKGAIPTIVSTMTPKLGTTKGDAICSPDECRAIDVLVQVGRPAVARLTQLGRTSRHGGVKGASAILTLAIMGEIDQRQVTPLVDRLRRRDFALVNDLILFYLYLGVGERELIAVLNERSDTSFDTISLLDSLATSGNRRLAAAARDWARRHGGTLTVTGETGTTWAITKLLLRTFCEGKPPLLTCHSRAR